MVEAGCCVRRRPAQREPVVRRAWSVVSQLCRAASSSAACTSLSLPYQTLTSTDRCRLHSLGALQRPVADKHRAQPEKSRARDKHTSAQDQGPAWSGCRVRPRVRACSGPRRCSCGAVADLYVTAGAIRSQRRRTRGPVLPNTQEWARCSQVFKPSDTWRHDGAHTSASSGPVCAFCSNVDSTTLYSKVCSRWSPSSTCSGGHSLFRIGRQACHSGTQVLAL